MGVSRQVIEESLSSFSGLKHRMQMVGRVEKVSYINDSKATNLDSALKSISSIEGRKVVILGGRDKAGDFFQLKDELSKEQVESVLLIGEAAVKIFGQLKILSRKMKLVNSLKEAVEQGYGSLKDKGGTVILAPGCASFDMYDNFEHRGLEFERAVNNFKKNARDRVS
jgi:UDP-N-acetylmuramoylalanine--D-glutamate ligase